MPEYFIISSKKVDLPYKKGNGVQIIIEGNTSWDFSPSAGWIELDKANGNGSGTVLVNSTSDNPDDVTRSGKIYIYSGGILSDSIMVTQNGVRKSFRIEAEDYVEMLGLQTESTSDLGGGQNLGYVDVNDWVTYNLDITAAGIYNVIFRHAGYEGNFDVLLNDTYLQTVVLPETSDWQDWTSHTVQMELHEGQYILKFKFNQIGINLNWMQFDWVSPLNIEAFEKYNLKVYPTPADNYLNIEFGSFAQAREIQLYSADGKKLLLLPCRNPLKESIDVSGFKEGVYILKVRFNSFVYTGKVVIN